ncbi:hypothetical protein LDENG_00148130 [Lucifuga dentata]|nr:hypothetical protein LDENG_00148130 [Lucifuga dentata]
MLENSRSKCEKTPWTRARRSLLCFLMLLLLMGTYQFILDEPDRCQQQSPFLVLMVPVAPQNKEARDAIRQTWGKETIVLGQVVSHYFLLGRAKEGDEAEPLKEQGS